MKFYQGTFKNLKPLNLKGSVVVIGYFDGLHHYHEKLLQLATKIAQTQNLPLILITFDQKIRGNAQKVIADDLMSSAEKRRFIEKKYPIDYYLELEVNWELQHLEALNFLIWLQATVQIKMIVEGSDFCFGYRGGGNIRTLQEFLGIKNVHLLARNREVSSSKIRKALAAGEIAQALKWLNHPLPFQFVPAIAPSKGESLIFPQCSLQARTYQLVDEEGKKWTLNYFNHDHIELKPFVQWAKNQPLLTLYLTSDFAN